MGQVGLEWSIAGFGDFSGNANETDMLMRNSNTGVFELFDISNNTIALGDRRWARSAWNGRSAEFRPLRRAHRRRATQRIAADPAGAPSSATAQLTQAMASFAPTAGAAATSSPINQTTIVPSITNNLLTASNHA